MKSLSIRKIREGYVVAVHGKRYHERFFKTKEAALTFAGTKL